MKLVFILVLINLVFAGIGDSYADRKQKERYEKRKSA